MKNCVSNEKVSQMCRHEFWFIQFDGVGLQEQNSSALPSFAYLLINYKQLIYFCFFY